MKITLSIESMTCVWDSTSVQANNPNANIEYLMVRIAYLLAKGESILNMVNVKPDQRFVIQNFQ